VRRDRPAEELRGVTAKRKGHRELPSLDGVQIKMDRAELHAAELDKAFWSVFPSGTCKTTVEVHDEGRRHVYRADHPPAADPLWGAIAGDAIHNLRTALDHLAHQLVLLSGGQPSGSTAFPILSRPPWTWCDRRKLPVISGGVSEAIRERLDSIQPYQRRHPHDLDALRDLDNIDKHKVIVAITTLSRAHGTTFDPGNPPPGSNTQWKRRPLKHGEVVAVVVYETPYPQPDPHLRFHPQPSFGVGQPLAREDVRIAVKASLRDRVQETIDLFRPIFER
jgi:hypothetical protein